MELKGNKLIIGPPARPGVMHFPDESHIISRSTTLEIVTRIPILMLKGRFWKVRSNPRIHSQYT